MSLAARILSPQLDVSSQDPAFLQARVAAQCDRVAENESHLLRGRLPERNALLLVSNDYLDLGSHPDVIGAKVRVLREEGHGLLRSDVFRHGPGPLTDFERDLARLLQSEDTVLCQSGWAANVGLMQSIADAGTPVYLDMQVHTSMWEGIKSAGANGRPFRHNDPDSLEKMHGRYGPGIVVVETVYSTSGGVCPLSDIVDVAEQFGSVLVVDESHSLGVFGPQGAGIAVAEGLAARIHFRTASLSKAFAARGGMVAGSARNIEFFRYESFPAIFSTGVLPHEAAGFQATLKLIRGGHRLRERLHANADYLRYHLPALEYNIGESQSQIVSIIAGSEARTLVLRDALESHGIFGSVFCWPATARNRALIRFSVNSSITEEELVRLVAVCEQIRNEVGREEKPAPKIPDRPAEVLPPSSSWPGFPALFGSARR